MQIWLLCNHDQEMPDKSGEICINHLVGCGVYCVLSQLVLPYYRVDLFSDTQLSGVAYAIC